MQISNDQFGKPTTSSPADASDTHGDSGVGAVSGKGQQNHPAVSSTVAAQETEDTAHTPFASGGIAGAASVVAEFAQASAARVNHLRAFYAKTPKRGQRNRKMRDLRMYISSTFDTENNDTETFFCLRDVVMDATADVYALGTTQRTRFIAKLIKRKNPTALQFRVAEMLCHYVEMLPMNAEPLGGYVATEDCLVFAWETAHGVYLDLVDINEFYSGLLRETVEEIRSFGREVWGINFAGIRYLPLDDLSKVRLFETSGARLSAECIPWDTDQ